MKSVANAPARSKPAPGPTPARTDPISTTDQTAKPRSRTQTNTVTPTTRSVNPKEFPGAMQDQNYRNSSVCETV
ncbi:hypothetical protein M8J77_003020 [Diaphorina citri]|nr:hypothetical protein M8J77_003020 [Diaphorina citri]